jgi:hypothetical protein
MSEFFVDSSGNRITVSPSGRTLDGRPILIVRLASEPDAGYIALDEGYGAFGTEECPSSYGMSCMSWFGTGERFPTPHAAIAAIAN